MVFCVSVIRFETLKRARDRFVGDGEASVSVPILDGALRPNNLLETAPVLLERSGLEDLTVASVNVLCAACGNEVLRIDAQGGVESAARFDATVQALAECHDGSVVLRDGGRDRFKCVARFERGSGGVRIGMLD